MKKFFDEPDFKYKQVKSLISFLNWESLFLSLFEEEDPLIELLMLEMELREVEIDCRLDEIDWDDWDTWETELNIAQLEKNTSKPKIESVFIPTP